MSSQPDFVRITLRLPAKLHRALTEQAVNRSLNAEIVDLLESSMGADETAGGFHFLDAIEPDVVPRARVIARLHLAAATNLRATDVVLLDPEITKRIADATGDERRVHDAAKAAIEAAFPLKGITWAEMAEALDALGAKAPAPAKAVREALEKRLADTPAMAGQVAL